jgi:hypothetical protein
VEIAITCSPRTLRSLSRSSSIWVWVLPNSTEALPRAKPEFRLSFPYLQQSSASFLTTGRKYHSFKNTSKQKDMHISTTIKQTEVTYLHLFGANSNKTLDTSYNGSLELLQNGT